MELTHEKLRNEGILVKQQWTFTFLKNYIANRYYIYLVIALVYSKGIGILT
jgi:hypothetical protein